MNNIIIYGDAKNKKILYVLLNFLKSNHSLTIFEKNTITQIGNGTPINIIITNNMKIIEPENSIIILAENPKVKNIKILNKNVKIIINDIKTSQAIFISKKSQNFLTCGFCNRDYITFSSKNENCCSISLQRAVYNNSNKLCEPFEISCIFSDKLSDYEILSAVMTLILIDEVNEINCKDKKIVLQP